MEAAKEEKPPVLIRGYKKRSVHFSRRHAHREYKSFVSSIISGVIFDHQKFQWLSG